MTACFHQGSGETGAFCARHEAGATRANNEVRSAERSEVCMNSPRIRISIQSENITFIIQLRKDNSRCENLTTEDTEAPGEEQDWRENLSAAAGRGGTQP